MIFQRNVIRLPSYIYNFSDFFLVSPKKGKNELFSEVKSMLIIEELYSNEYKQKHHVIDPNMHLNCDQ